jgi:asparagine synthase (glutamine-hydrolysing)
LFGKEISDEARHGAYLMPFLDHQLVALGVALPMALKNAGRFEAMLIAAIDPELARQPSAYGHSFTEPPSMAHRLSEWSTRLRPAWARQRSYAIQRRLGPVRDEHGGLLTPDYLGRVVDLEFPLMRRFIRPDRIGGDTGLLRRVACLEYLGAKLGVTA